MAGMRSSPGKRSTASMHGCPSLLPRSPLSGSGSGPCSPPCRASDPGTLPLGSARSTGSATDGSSSGRDSVRCTRAGRRTKPTRGARCARRSSTKGSRSTPAYWAGSLSNSPASTTAPSPTRSCCLTRLCSSLTPGWVVGAKVVGTCAPGRRRERGSAGRLGGGRRVLVGRELVERRARPRRPCRGAAASRGRAARLGDVPQQVVDG